MALHHTTISLLHRACRPGFGCALLLLVLGASPQSTTAEEFAGFELVIPPAQFVLPRFSGPYREREASIAPQELEMAEQITTLLENDQREEVLAKLEELFDIEMSPAMLALKAQVYASLERYDEAEQIYLSVLRRKPDLTRVNADLAQLYLIQEDFEKARQYFSRAVVLGSSDALVHGQLAYVNLKLHGPFSAIDGYQRALSIEPDNPQWLRGLLAALTQARMYESALALLDELIGRDPDAPELWLNKAALAFQMEQSETALVAVEMALLLGDKSPQNIRTAVQLHLQQGSYDRAVALLEGGLDGSALNIALADEAIRWLTHKGLPGKARAVLKAIEPQLASMPALERSDFYLNRGRLDELAEAPDEQIRASYRRALELNPVNGAALLAYAAYLAEQGDYADAEFHYVRAEAVAGSEKDAMLGRAQLYVDRKDYLTAVKQLRLVIQKFPELGELQENIEILQSIVRATEGS